MKKILITLSIVIAVCAFFAVIMMSRTPNLNESHTPSTQPEVVLRGQTPLHTTYRIGDAAYALVGGRVEKRISQDSATVERVMVFGEPIYGDLDADEDEDAALFLAQDSGGSGTFYFVALAINDGGIYKGTNAMFLGDRIAPQTLEIHDGRAVANYAERKAGEPFTTSPSVGKSVFIHLDPTTNQIGELAQNFEGEADPSRMSLSMKKWKWIRTEYFDGKNVEPKKPDVFAVTFRTDGNFSVSTDCNGMGGQYTTKGDVLTFSAMMMTKMFCEGAQEGEFSAMLSDVAGYNFTSKGELVLLLKNKKGSIFFR
jgi:heat shock protein HslJ